MENEESSGKAISADELPPEFKRFERPLGLKQYQLNRILLLLAHWGTIYYAYLLLSGQTPVISVLFGLLYGYMCGLGVTIGAHRYWSHRSFKAKMPLQILLMLWQTGAVQYPAFKWAWDHRVHHKYVDTNADPHNVSRGFWFSQILWLIVPKHPDHIEKLKAVDISDLTRDPVLRFQAKYYWTLVLFFFLIIPGALNKLICPEMSYWHIFVIAWARFGIELHITGTVNSVAHMLGDKPYNKYIRPVENKLVAILAVGEGWHNYHHTFPWDYSASEFGNRLNLSTALIHFFAWIGWAYDMKTVSHKMLVDRINRTGDGSSPLHKKIKNGNKEESNGENSSRKCWGWGDKQLSKKDLEVTETVFPANNQRG